MKFEWKQEREWLWHSLYSKGGSSVSTGQFCIYISPPLTLPTQILAPSLIWILQQPLSSPPFFHSPSLTPQSILLLGENQLLLLLCTNLPWRPRASALQLHPEALELCSAWPRLPLWPHLSPASPSPLCSSDPEILFCYHSKCGYEPWELLRNATSQASPQTRSVRICILTRSCAHWRVEGHSPGTYQTPSLRVAMASACMVLAQIILQLSPSLLSGSSSKITSSESPFLKKHQYLKPYSLHSLSFYPILSFQHLTCLVLHWILDTKNSAWTWQDDKYFLNESINEWNIEHKVFIIRWDVLCHKRASKHYGNKEGGAITLDRDEGNQRSFHAGLGL